MQALDQRTLGALREHGLDVRVDAAECGAASEDFGRLCQGDVRAVVRPRDAQQIASLMRHAGEHGLTLTPRALGNSQSGQSIARGSLTLDLTALDQIGAVDVDRGQVRAGAGVTFRQLLSATLPSGFVPRVMPLNLDITLGGALSAGGFGSASHRYGPCVSNVIDAEIVTGGGERLEVSPTRERAAYDAVFGGLGRCGVIASANVALRRTGKRIRTFFLLYDQLPAMLGDQRVLKARPEVEHMEGFCSALVQGLYKGPTGRRRPLALWSYGLHVSVEEREGPSMSAEALTHGLHHSRLLHIEEDTPLEFASRYDIRFEAMRATGAYRDAHPWLECLLPMDVASELVPRVLEMLPMFLGDGHRITLVADTDRPRSLRFPESSQPAVAFAILPMGVPAALREPALQALEAVHQLLLSRGGKRYLSGWLFDWNEAAWRAHLGDYFESWRTDKSHYDPLSVLTSVLHQRA